MNKKGLSAVIVSMMLILLAIIVVSVVWVSYSSGLERAQEQVDARQECLGIDVRLKKVSCVTDSANNESDCSVTIEPKTEADKVDGVYFVAFNSDLTESERESSTVSLKELEIKTFDVSFDDPFNDTTSLKKFRIAPYYDDDLSGETIICSESSIKDVT